MNEDEFWSTTYRRDAGIIDAGIADAGEGMIEEDPTPMQGVESSSASPTYDTDSETSDADDTFIPGQDVAMAGADTTIVAAPEPSTQIRTRASAHSQGSVKDRKVRTKAVEIVVVDHIPGELEGETSAEYISPCKGHDTNDEDWNGCLITIKFLKKVLDKLFRLMDELLSNDIRVLYAILQFAILLNHELTHGVNFFSSTWHRKSSDMI